MLLEIFQRRVWALLFWKRGSNLVLPLCPCVCLLSLGNTVNAWLVRGKRDQNLCLLILIRSRGKIKKKKKDSSKKKYVKRFFFILHQLLNYECTGWHKMRPSIENLVRSGSWKAIQEFLQSWRDKVLV